MAPYYVKASDWQAIFDIYKSIRNDAYSAMSYIFTMIDDNNIDLAHYKHSYVIKTVPVHKNTGETLFDDLERASINIAKKNLFKGSILMHENMFVSLTHQNALEQIITHFEKHNYDLKKTLYQFAMNKPDDMQEMYLHHLHKGTFSLDDSYKVFVNTLKTAAKELSKTKKLKYFSSHDSHIEKHLNILHLCSMHYDNLDQNACHEYFNDFITVFTHALPEHVEKLNTVKAFFLRHDTSMSEQQKQQYQKNKPVSAYACESFILHMDTNQVAYETKREIESVKSILGTFYEFLSNESTIYNHTFTSIINGKLAYGDSSDNIIDMCVVVKPGNSDLVSKIQLLFEQVHYSMQTEDDINMKMLWKNINLYYDMDKSLEQKTVPHKKRAKI